MRHSPLPYEVVRILLGLDSMQEVEELVANGDLRAGADGLVEPVSFRAYVDQTWEEWADQFVEAAHEDKPE